MPPFPTFPVLTTGRVRLREIVPADAPDLFAFRRDPEEQRHNDPPLTHPDEADALIERLAREYREHGVARWGLTLDDDVVVGLFGYNTWDTTNRRASVGYDLKRSLWGRGLATEAMRSILGFGFEEMALNRIEAHTNAANVRSIHMLRRLGFWREGTFHEHFFEDGQFHDVALFALLRRDRVGHIAGADQPGNILVTRRS
jgi:[ribosomal protein S5]-alanine N-acetyltransferase